MTDDVTALLDAAGADVHGELARIREHGPVVRVELPGGVPVWLVTSHTVARRLLTDPAVSKDPRHWPALETGEIPSDWVMSPWIRVRNMLTTSGADHTRLRKALAPAFTKRRTDALRPRIAALTTELLDTLQHHTAGGEIVDLRAGFARPLPIRVITELMGLPPHLAAPLCEHADAVLTAATGQQIDDHFAAMMAVGMDAVAAKRAEPGEDLTSVLIAAADDGRLSEQELLDTLVLVVSAGHETTVNLLDHAITTLLTSPQLRADVLDARTLWADFIEETLRMEPPLANMPLRFARRGLDLDDGTHIAEGDAIVLSWAAANRDPAVYGDTGDEFVPNRDAGGTTHLSFGYGTHHCLGASLARLEARVALPALFARFPHMRLATDPAELRQVPSCVLNGHTTLPIDLSGHEEQAS